MSADSNRDQDTYDEDYDDEAQTGELGSVFGEGGARKARRNTPKGKAHDDEDPDEMSALGDEEGYAADEADAWAEDDGAEHVLGELDFGDEESAAEDGLTAEDYDAASGTRMSEGHSAEEEDMLFSAPEISATSEQFDSGPPFRDDEQSGQGRGWGGHVLPADEIGIPADQEAYLVDDDLGIDGDQELELVDEQTLDGDYQPNDAYALDEEGTDDFELVLDEDVYEQAAADVVEGDGGYQAGFDGSGAVDDEFAEQPSGFQAGGQEFFVLDEREEGAGFEAQALPEFPIEEGWEPVGEGDEEPAPEEAPVDYYAPTPPAFASDADATYEEGEELYYDDTLPAVVGAPRRQRRLLRVLSSLAAAVMVVGAGAVVVLRPEWFGLHFKPELVERVQLTRPQVEVRVPTPPPPQVSVTDPTPVRPIVSQPDPVQPELPTDPQPTVPEPVDPQPVVPDPRVGQVDPLPTDPVAVEPPLLQSDVAAATPEFLPVGEELWVGQFRAEGGRMGWSPVPLGSRAFAQLHNGNFFVGHVKAVAADTLILRVDDGEVALQRDELQTVTPLDSDEYAELQKVTTGFLRLSNSNRLVGNILQSVDDDNYILQMRSDRIVVPKAFVDKMVRQGGAEGLRFGDTNDEDKWLQQLAARHLRAMATGEAEPEQLPVRFSNEDVTTRLPLQKEARQRPASRTPPQSQPTPARPEK